MPLPTLKILTELSVFARRKATFTAADLAGVAGLQPDHTKELKRFLDILVAAAVLRFGRKQRYLVVGGSLQLVDGVVRVQSAGYAFLEAEDRAEEDLYISSFRLDSAMDGDSAVALVLPQGHGRGHGREHSRGHGREHSRGHGGRPRRNEGLIVSITGRAHQTVCGICRRQQHNGQLLCHSSATGAEFIVAGDKTALSDTDRLDGRCVLLNIERYPSVGIAGMGSVVEVLGVAGDPKTDVYATAYKHGIPTVFDDEVMREAQRVAREPGPAEFKERMDLRALPLVTIDGADARDFDDAVALENSSDGWKLWVAIADVSHYVVAGSTLDAAAYERGTSAYFPGFSLPMLPRILSNGVCSLNPAVDRLVLAVELDFDENGQRRAMDIHPAVMRSAARLTYTQVQSCLDADDNGDCDEITAVVAAMLREMAQLAQLLRAGRIRRGAIDFDLPEADIRLGASGMPIYIGRRLRTMAHRLIEEFMLAANEAVAHWVEQRSGTTLYRVHEAPDMQSLHAFQQFIAAFNLGFNLSEDGVHPGELQQLLHQVHGSEQEYIVNQIMLRMMQQAHYSAENCGHFGLASEAYCHFTSPIRRYPDLVQHRMVLKLLRGEAGYTKERLSALAQHCTTTERRAMAAERDIVDLRKCQFMLDKVGERFSGYITTVTEFGFFVELNEFFVEGLVHIRSLKDDFYIYEPERHRLLGRGKRNIFRVGMAVDIEVARINTEQRQIDFVLPAMNAKHAVVRHSRGIGRHKHNVDRSRRRRR